LKTSHLLALTVAFFARTVAAQAPPPPAAPAAPETSASTDSRPQNSDATPGRAVWATTYDEAKQRARQETRVVFVEFWRKKCGNCFRMDGLLYPSVNFEMALLRAVPVKLDLDSAEGAALARRYGVNDVPAILVVSPGGAIIFRMVGFEGDRSFYQHLHNSMVEWDEVNLKIVHEPETIHDGKSQLELGKELFRRMDSEEAIPRFERASSGPKTPPAVREEALSYLASAQMDLEHFTDARATIE
jgi:thiol-disulfide isomerase/thioredoxin